MDERSKIKEANAKFYEALSSQNLEVMEVVWLHEPWVRCLHPGWKILSGWESIRKSWASIFKNTEYLKVEISDLTIKVGKDMAWVVCTENIASAQSTSYQTATALTTNIFHKVNEVWLLAHHHASPVTINEPLEAPESIQ